MCQRVDVQFRLSLRGRQNGLDLGAENQTIGFDRIVQWFDPDAVACEQQRARGPMPEGDAKHASQAREDGVAPLLITVNYDFGVAVGGEPVTGGEEFCAELAVVVDLSVEHDLDRAVFVADRLMAPREVDDAQPPHAKGCALSDKGPFVVGPTMTNHLAHAVDDTLGARGCPGSIPLGSYESSDPTHE